MCLKTFMQVKNVFYFICFRLFYYQFLLTFHKSVDITFETGGVDHFFKYYFHAGYFKYT